MQRKFTMLLVLVMALSLVMCFGVTAWAADEPDTDTTTGTPTEDVTPTEGETPTDEEAPTTEDGDEEPFVIPVPESVAVSTQALSIDGELVEAEAYNIDGANYFKLRDLAALLAGTGCEFNVEYEAPNMIVTTGEAYTKLDTDLVKGDDKSDTCVPSTQVLMVNGEKVDVLVYNIGGSNFFQLRGLETLVGFTVGYDDETRTIVVETAAADTDAPDTDETPDTEDTTETE